MISKKYLLILISLFILGGIGILLACGWSGDDEPESSFFAPEVMESSEFWPFFKSWHKLYTFGDHNILNNFNEVNLKEWESYFHKKISKDDLSALLYGMSVKKIDSLIIFMNNKSNHDYLYLQKLAICKLKYSKTTKDFMSYLLFAKRCEPFSTIEQGYSSEGWEELQAWRNSGKDHQAEMRKLIDEGIREIKSLKNNFVRQRYLFQILRLYFNLSDYQLCYNFFTDHQNALFSINNSIKYRAIGYAAGALNQLNRIAESNHLYALAYDGSDEMKIQAYLSFRPEEESDWNECFLLAKTVREKMVLWHLLGLFNDPLRAMKEIYKLNPKSDLIEPLLMRSINGAEEQFIPNGNDYSNENSFKLDALNLDTNLVNFTIKVADRGNTLHPYLWNLSAGYLKLVQRDFKLSDSYLTKAERKTRSKLLIQNQIALLRTISSVEQLDKPDSIIEASLFKNIPKLEGNEGVMRNYNAFQWIKKRLSQKYAMHGDYVKAKCLNPAIESDMTFYYDSVKVQDMISYMDKKNKTNFDLFLLSLYQVKKTDIYEVLALRELYAFKPKAAVTKFLECKGSGDTKLNADPFLIHIRDCHDCDHAAERNGEYTILSFAQHMSSLEDSMIVDPSHASYYLFKLGNAYYNMTYFGNSRIVYEVNISESEERSFDCSKAEECYTKAMELSKDPEFKTMCCFMAAKCEHNSFYPGLPHFYDSYYDGKYFGMLKKTFSRTNYFKDIIQECGYFKTYIKVSEEKN